ncbi:mitochondrial potassium channel [Stegostoma tigrinum]|uniref:mitochondrial potassium channel n=1 Tax=Stegostoma tigrinum TaxID=3053191 RepID=UPI00202B62EC|nr:mitochondrial potassium channel [Stegostoma tigrinum]XP_048403949.1 mitochondrial potassium channel [Stegostoma tigrinum]XP_048403950.1 mitochondrial potassium channel [Stegostoma tigrinum]XP_048403951.1 mitochondrial potassium channel [Stegostoma tigrinum]XP_048403952.1 mitochondrial potassium channel [Stegostoma tigrinum]
MKRQLLSVMCPRASCFHIARSNSLQVRVYCSQPTQKTVAKTLNETTNATQLKWVELSKDLSKKTVEHIRITTNSLWEKYEEFVGLKEVQVAQLKVTEAEKAFMVARGVVRQSRETLENQQLKLKEVRDRLDRVSREDNHYLELATQEHKLLQEERRHRTAYENAEELERETFALFSAAVRESHEKERTRAERTKNWSVIGSVLGAMIGVLGSTYINRVRLQELKGLLLEAQKGPINLQEALKEQASIHQIQSQKLNTLVTNLKELVHDKSAFQQAGKEATTNLKKAESGLKPDPVMDALKKQASSSKQTSAALEGLELKLNGLEQAIGKVASDIRTVKSVTQAKASQTVSSELTQDWQILATENMIDGLAEMEKRLETHIQASSLYNTMLTYAAFALTLPVLYMLFKGN